MKKILIVSAYAFMFSTLSASEQDKKHTASFIQSNTRIGRLIAARVEPFLRQKGSGDNGHEREVIAAIIGEYGAGDPTKDASKNFYVETPQNGNLVTLMNIKNGERVGFANTFRLFYDNHYLIRIDALTINPDQGAVTISGICRHEHLAKQHRDTAFSILLHLNTVSLHGLNPISKKALRLEASLHEYTARPALTYNNDRAMALGL